MARPPLPMPPDTRSPKSSCDHVWRYAHVVKQGLQKYRIYYCERCLAEEERRVYK